jgi:hypothetical protein
MASTTSKTSTTSPRMTYTRAKQIVTDFGDRKLLAPRVRHMLAYTGFSTAEIAEKIFELYAGASKRGADVPAGFGSTSMDTAMLVARMYEDTLAGKGFNRADETLIFECLVAIARAQVADGGAKPGLEKTCQAAVRKRTTASAVTSIVDAEAAVNRAANARRKGTRVASTVTDTPDGRAAIASHDESAAEARKGETKAERKARLSSERAQGASEREASKGGDKGKGAVTPRTPESGPDPLAPATDGNSTDKLPGSGTPVSKPAPAKVKSLAEATTPDLIRALRNRLGAGLKITTTLDEMFEVLAREWSERALETPASETPERERKATAERAAKIAANKVKTSAPVPTPNIIVSREGGLANAGVMVEVG